MKNKLIKFLAIVALAGLTCGTATSCGLLDQLTSSFQPTWDVSLAQDQSITAYLSRGKDGSASLRLKGEGDMLDWTSADEVPWASKASNIEEVIIGEGIASIGNYAFKGLQVDNVVLPESVTWVGREAIAENTSLFVYSADVEYADENLDNIFLYSEEMPETDDRYWQSDKSKQDIITAGEGVRTQNWHFNEDDEAEEWDKIKILFVGNSFTYRNGRVEFSSGVPGIFDNIAKDLGYYVETYSVTGPGWYLYNHAKPTDTCGKQIDLLLNEYDDFDYVVLQDQSLASFENYTNFLAGIQALQTKIEATQEDAQIYLYETWGSPFSANERKITVPEMERKILKGYNDAAEACGVEVSYVGRAFTYIYNTQPAINLYDTDNRHQGYPGAYLSACVHVAAILGGDVSQTTFEGETQYNAPTLPASTYEALRYAACEIVFDGLDVDATENQKPAEKPNEYSLEIAIWGRWITEAQFQAFYAGFEGYCAKNNIDTSKAHYTYYTGKTTSDPYYYIANFTGAVVGNGGADIVFPCATNLTTQNGTQIKQATITPLNITLNGKTDRCVAQINKTELSDAFYNFCLSTEGRKLLDPNAA